MDIEDTLRAQQVAKIKAAASNDDVTRQTHAELAAGFAQRIAILREMNEAKLRRRDSKPLRHVAVNDSVWNPASALGERRTDKCPEIVVHRMTEYSVGPYRYGTFEDALAEQIRIAEAQVTEKEE